MNYNKKIKDAIFTLHNGDEMHVFDTDTNEYATHALAQFKSMEDVELNTVDGKNIAPFHSIIKVVATEETIDMPYEDANCNYVCDCGGDDEGKQGIKSISIRPAITTTPALDSLFPIYWEDLPEGEIEEGVEYRNYDATLHTGHALTNGTEYSVTSTPSSEWHIDSITGGGDAGETVTTTDMVRNGALTLGADAKDSSGTKCISVLITITE